MQAYNYHDLYNKFVQDQSSEAFHTKSIREDAYNNIVKSYPCHLYTPNYFIRIALGLLTFVAVLFSGFLLALVFSTSSNSGAMGLCIFLGIICYTALELLVQQKCFYNAGVDNLLQCFTIIFVVSALVVTEPPDMYLAGSFIAMLGCLLLCIRFTDAFMAMLSYLSLFSFVILLYLKLGGFARITAPFVMMIVSGCTYLLMTKLMKHKKFLFYQFSYKAVILLTLLTFYASGNYFVVQIFDLGPKSTNPMAYGWMFWMFTLAIPPIYILYGVLKKNLIFIRTGLGLAAVSVVTYRYFFAILSNEAAMLIAGVILTAGSYILIKYLKTPKYGFSFDKDALSQKELLNAEALIIAQAFGKKTTGDSNTFEFGGGSFGGGGAGAKY